jgi:peptidyl-prolyl cis-trans isomerase SurA
MIPVLCTVLAVSAFTPLDRVVAVVGERPILHSDVMELLEGTGVGAEELAEAGTGSGDLYMQALDALVEEKLLLEGAVRAGYYPDQQEVEGYVDDRISEMRAEFPSEQAFMSAMSDAGLTMEYLRSQLTVNIGDQMAVDQYVGAMTREAFTHVTTDPATFLSGSAEAVEETMMPRHLYWIYIPVLPSGPGLDAETAFLLELRARIEAGEPFGELATQWSEDGSAEDGGDLGWFSEGDMTPAFESAAFSLGTGEVSMPVVTPFGVHLIRVDDREDGSIRASHILRIVEPGPSDYMHAEARADSIADLIREGLPFADAAALFSADARTASLGGDLGVVLVRAWDTDYADALESVGPGQVTDPVPADGRTAVLLLMTTSSRYDGTSVDWSGYSDSYLSDLARSVAFQNEFDSLKDSLLTVIPVIYRPDTDED